MEQVSVKKMVRDSYGKIAQGVSKSCCGASKSSAQKVSMEVGYTSEELKTLPENANMGLGCGNPTAMASIIEGETVLDLGSGGGIDCFLAAQKTGPTGKVIGVDMTAEMIDRARLNAAKTTYSNVEFRLGEIEHLPVADSSIDIIISNCVINLSQQKEQVFKETYRVLKDGGRMMISDIVITKDLPESVLESISAYVGCIAGAEKKDNYLDLISAAGFRDVVIVEEQTIPAELWMNDPIAEKIREETGLSKGSGKEFLESIVSIKVSAKK